MLLISSAPNLEVRKEISSFKLIHLSHNYGPAFPFWLAAVQLTFHNNMKCYTTFELFRNNSPMENVSRAALPKALKGRLNRVLCRSNAL